MVWSVSKVGSKWWLPHRPVSESWLELTSDTTKCASRRASSCKHHRAYSVTIKKTVEPMPMGLGRGLTDCSCFTLSHRFHDADDTAGLQGWLEPVRGVLHIGHVNAQAAILTQQNHGCPLLFIAGSVPNGNHVLYLGKGKGTRNVSSHSLIKTSGSTSGSGCKRAAKRERQLPSASFLRWGLSI